MPTATSSPTPLPEPTGIPDPTGRVVYLSAAGGVANLWMVEAECALVAAGCKPEQITDAARGILLAVPHPSSPTRLAYLGPAPSIALPAPPIRHIDVPDLYQACLDQPGACRRILLTPEEAALYVLELPDDTYTHDLWRVDIATGSMQPLHVDPGPPTLHDAYWIPTGAFITEFDDLNREVRYQANPEPSSPSEVIACAGYPEAGIVVGSERAWMSWSPDGTRVAAACRVTHETISGLTYVMGSVLNVYDVAAHGYRVALPDPLPVAHLDMRPFWLPDGVTVVFTRADISRQDLLTPDSLMTLGPRRLWYVDTNTGDRGLLLPHASQEHNYELLGWMGDKLLVRDTPYQEVTLPADDIWAWEDVLQQNEGAMFWLMDPETFHLSPADRVAPYVPGAPILVHTQDQSPDGVWQVFERDGGLWLRNIEGGEYPLVANGLRPVWVP